MKRALLLAGACAILALPAFAQTPSPPSAPPQNAPASASPAPPPTPSTADFVKKAAISGMFEVQSSELALRKRVPADRRFAEDMIRDHEHIAAQLKHLVRADHVKAQIPAALDGEHKKMLDQLRGETGATFDKDYDAMQQKGHREAVSLFQSYSQSGDNPALKQWAAKTLPTLQSHLDMAEKLS
jgi:putative membrane protein